MYYSPTRLIPEIFEIIDNAASKEEQLQIVKAYSIAPNFLVICDVWLNKEFDDYSNVLYPTHKSPIGLAPQSISNNMKRIVQLTRDSKLSKEVKDKYVANIFHSINQNEIEFLTNLFADTLEQLYPNVTKELIKEAISKL